MQLRLDPGLTQALFFLAVSEDGKEYSKLGVGHNLRVIYNLPGRGISLAGRNFILPINNENPLFFERAIRLCLYIYH